VKNDYEFYEKHIRRFNKDLFRFGDLEDRKSAYVGLAETQRQRAQIQLRRVFYALLIVWCGLAIWSGFAYSFGQPQSLALAVSGVVLAILSLDPTDGPFGHGGYDYFLVEGGDSHSLSSSSFRSFTLYFCCISESSRTSDWTVPTTHFESHPSLIVRVNYTSEVYRFSLRGMQGFRPCARAGCADGECPEPAS